MLEMNSKSYISGVVEVLPDRGNADIVHQRNCEVNDINEETGDDKNDNI